MKENYIFGAFKQNFLCGDRVIIGRTNSNLDGITGFVVGKSNTDVVDAYIIKLDENPINDWECIVLTEVCLSKL